MGRDQMVLLLLVHLAEVSYLKVYWVDRQGSSLLLSTSEAEVECPELQELWTSWRELPCPECEDMCVRGR